MKKLTCLLMLTTTMFWLPSVSAMAQTATSADAIQARELSADEYSSFAAAISAMGTSQTILVIASSQTVNTAVTVPANVILRFTGNGQLIGTGSVTITGRLEGPARQLFASTLTLSLGRSRVLQLDPHWFGAVGDGTTDDFAALQRMLNIVSGGNGYSGDIYIAKGTYAIKNTLTYEGQNGIGVRFHGALGGDRGPVGTVFKWIGPPGGVVFYLLGVNGSTFSDFTIDAQSTARYGLFIDATNEYSDGLASTRISAISRSSDLVSVTSASHGLSVGDTIKVAGVTDRTFNGTWIVASVRDADHFTYLNGGRNESSSGGAVLKYKSHPSSGNVFNRIGISNPNGTDSAAIAIAHAAPTTEQVSELDFHNLFLQGRQVLHNSYYGIKAFQGGNVKNIRVHSGSVDGFDYAFEFSKGSGIISIADTVIANIQVADIKIGSGVYYVKSVEVEDQAPSTQFITGTTGNNAGSLTVESCTWVGIAPPDNDAVISYQGAMLLIGNLFQNNRTGSSVAKILVSNPLFAESQAGSVYSTGNFYQNASGYIPVLDGSNNPVTPGSGVYGNQSVAITSVNDYGGMSGGIVRLKNYGSTSSLISQQPSGNLVPANCLVCMAKNDVIKFRNHADNGDLNGLSKDTADVVQVGDKAGAKTAGSLTVTGQTYTPRTNMSFSPTPTIDFATSNVRSMTLTGNITSVTWSNRKDGAIYVITLIQDGRGNRTFAWGSSVKWIGGQTPVLTTTAGARDIFTFLSDGANLYEISRALDVK